MLDIESRLTSIVIRHFGLPTNYNLRPKTRFIDDLGADSLNIVELVMRIEDKFAIEISDEELESFQTFEQAVRLVSRKCGQN